MADERSTPARVSAACDRCRKNKSRCDSYRPCSLCLRAKTECATNNRNSKRLDPPQAHDSTRRDASESIPHPSDGPKGAGIRKRRRNEAEADSSDARSTGRSHDTTDEDTRGNWTSVVSLAQADPQQNAIPREDDSVARKQRTEQTIHVRNTNAGRAMSPSGALLLHALPSKAVMVCFLHEYFTSVHWFSLVIYEPTFRALFDCVRNDHVLPSQRPFLLLLSVVLGLGAWYRGQRNHSPGEPSAAQSKTWSRKLIANAESQIIEILDQSSVTAVQTLILLGSFFVYHGRPNLSFSLLGATVKSAHAAGLHKKSTTPNTLQDEERRRVWWTIYTWDRFASITYGRPISIDEHDCSVEMPSDVKEMVDFSYDPGADAPAVCFSTYQRELNKLYMVASPAIKQVYSIGETVSTEPSQVYISLLEDVTSRLWQWHRNLPDKLLLDLSQDCSVDLGPAQKAHRLQSLSLQLTFDSLLIVLHRPFLKRELNTLQCHGLSKGHGLGLSGLRPPEADCSSTSSRAPLEGPVLPLRGSSQQQWWNAASRTARIAQLPQLAQHACDGHLGAFLAINLFNAAIVMIVIALSDPLADAAQEAKRAIARICRLQGALDSGSSITKRSITVLRQLLLLLSKRESEVILNITIPQDFWLDSEHRLATPDSNSVPNVSALQVGKSVRREPMGDGLWGDSSNAHIILGLDDGLASVQRAITGFPSFNPRPEAEIQHRTTTISSTFDAIAFRDNSVHGVDELAQLDTGPATVSSEWSSGPADASNGVYWFWDASWDDLCRGGIEPP